MSIASFFISRPVASIVVNLIIGVLGLVCFGRLSIREYPNIEKKIVSVEMEYPGASVDVMETQIATRIEESLASISGISNSSTTITSGLTTTTIEFDQSRDLDSAASDVESRLRRIQGDLPDNTRPPVIRKTDPSARPSFILALYGGEYNTSELSDQMMRYVKNNLESISGVASVIVQGQTGSPTTYAIDVFMKAQAMSSANVTPDEVFRSVASQSFVQPAGDVTVGTKTYRMTVRAGLSSVPEFENIIVRERNGRMIRLKDIAEVKLNDDEQKLRIRYNGKTVSLCYVIIQSSANVIEISKKIKEKVNEIKQGLPDRNLKLEIVSDKSIYINASVHRLEETIIEAVILVAIVILLFLKSFRASLIPIVTIPICLLTGFSIMYFFGFTINIITLLALLLAVGLVVDDAVVVLERIVENMERGMNAVQASRHSIEEIQFSVIGMTLTLVSVYLPLSLATGTWGKFFNEFAITLAGMVLMSGIIAFILTPMMSSLILTKKSRTYAPVEWFNQIFEAIKGVYAKTLYTALNSKWLIILGSTMITCLSLYVAKYYLISISEPESDKGSINIRLSTNRSNLETISDVLSNYEELGNDPSVAGISSYFTAGSDEANLELILASDPTKRKSVKDIMKIINEKYNARFSEFMPQVMSASSPLGESNMFGIIIKTNKSYDELEMVGQSVCQVMLKVKGKYHPMNITFSRISPEKTYSIIPNRDRCYLVGARLEDVRNAIRYITRGNPPADRYEKDGKQYPVRVWVSEEDRQNPEIVKDFKIRTTRRSENQEDNDLVSLRDLVEIKETKVRPNLFRNSGQRSFTIWCKFRDKDIDYSKAYDMFKQSILKTLPPGYTISPIDSVKQVAAESQNLIFIITLALVFVYLVMSALFESFIDPFIVICTVPLAISWAILSLKLFPDGSLNAYSYIGMLTLIGLITKHGILLVEFFNSQFEKTKSLKSAAISSALERFRPIIMTTLAMVLGAVPLILKKGSGYEGPRQVGIILVGGMTFGTLMTIFVVPCLCIIFKQIQLSFAKWALQK